MAFLLFVAMGVNACFYSGFVITNNEVKVTKWPLVFGSFNPIMWVKTRRGLLKGQNA